jgi:hypothetical protein
MPKKLRPAVDLMAFKCRTLKVNYKVIWYLVQNLGRNSTNCVRKEKLLLLCQFFIHRLFFFLMLEVVPFSSQTRYRWQTRSLHLNCQIKNAFLVKNQLIISVVKRCSGISLHIWSRQWCSFVLLFFSYQRKEINTINAWNRASIAVQRDLD